MSVNGAGESLCYMEGMYVKVIHGMEINQLRTVCSALKAWPHRKTPLDPAIYIAFVVLLSSATPN